jgi:hypothetical protein
MVSDSKSKREDEVWKLKHSTGVIVGDDGLLYYYYKTLSYLDIMEVDAAGFNDEITNVMYNLIEAGFQFSLNTNLVPDTALDYMKIKDDLDYNMN